ncbi:hypothetical protein LguiB_003685 [Lonicera macranthoides]
MEWHTWPNMWTLRETHAKRIIPYEARMQVRDLSATRFRPKVIKQLRLDAKKKVKCEKVQEECPKKKSVSIPRLEKRKTPKLLPKRYQEEKSKSPSMNEVNVSVQE